MPLSPVPTAESWSAEILEAAREFFNGTIDVFIPGEPGTYDPVDDETTGGTPATPLISARPARAQHIAMPQQNSDVSGWNVRRRVRFQCEILAGDPVIPRGAVATYAGGNDPTLNEITFQVVSAINSSHAALRTIEAITEAGR